MSMWGEKPSASEAWWAVPWTSTSADSRCYANAPTYTAALRFAWSAVASGLTRSSAYHVKVSCCAELKLAGFWDWSWFTVDVLVSFFYACLGDIVVHGGSLVPLHPHCLRFDPELGLPSTWCFTCSSCFYVGFLQVLVTSQNMLLGVLTLNESQV